MNIKKIEAEELRKMYGKEGLVLQGCGGSLEEWVEGINEMLTKEEILLEGTVFNNCLSFDKDGITCLMFPFEDVKLNMGKFAMWRLATYGSFGGTWLSDYVPNRLGGFIEERNALKPDCPLIGQNGNVFNLMGIASRTLKNHGMSEQAEEMRNKIMASGSYEEALNILGEYVNITSMEDMENSNEEGEVISL